MCRPFSRRLCSQSPRSYRYSSPKKPCRKPCRSQSPPKELPPLPDTPPASYKPLKALPPPNRRPLPLRFRRRSAPGKPQPRALQSESVSYPVTLSNTQDPFKQSVPPCSGRSPSVGRSPDAPQKSWSEAAPAPLRRCAHPSKIASAYTGLGCRLRSHRLSAAA